MFIYLVLTSKHRSLALDVALALDMALVLALLTVDANVAVEEVKAEDDDTEADDVSNDVVVAEAELDLVDADVITEEDDAVVVVAKEDDTDCGVMAIINALSCSVC